MDCGGFTLPLDQAVAKVVTVQEAVKTFLEWQGAAGKGMERDTLRRYTVLLNKRLLPFCAEIRKSPTSKLSMISRHANPFN